MLELQALVRRSSCIRALGSRHSFSRCADTDGDLVDLRELPVHIALDETAREVACSASTTYAELAAYLEAHVAKSRSPMLVRPPTPLNA